MKSLISKIKKFNDAIKSISIDDVYHYDASTSSSHRYVVWAEETESDSLDLNNHLDEQIIKGSVDLFTNKEFDSLVDEIQETMDNNDISFSLFNVQYETETGYIHYTWNWEVS